jgi:hypothetical protein
VRETRGERLKHTVRHEGGVLEARPNEIHSKLFGERLTLHIRVKLRSCGPVRVIHNGKRLTTSALGMISDTFRRCAKPARMAAS